MAKSKSAAKSNTKSAPTKRPAKRSNTSNGSAAVSPRAAAEVPVVTEQRLLPTKEELTSLYKRYTGDAGFDEHDKAFYFVLDVGGISRARQLLAHVEEVLAEMEEFQH
jgi:hypothetical protein